MADSNLNNEQDLAARHKNGPLLIIAGAGAGKTKTITHRIKNLIENGTSPDKVLAVTFTNKAAAEMLERINSLLNTERATPPRWQDSGRPFIGTFHSLGVYILRNHGSHLGLSKHFTILDREDSLRYIKEAMKILDINPKQYEPKKILGRISRLKGQGLSYEDYSEEASKSRTGHIVLQIWRIYEDKISQNKALDFDDLLLKTYLLLQKNPAVLKFYQDKWSYIHVDEYQDTNDIQYSLVKMLCSDDNICVVGDVDQSIYSWRGANFENLMRFEEDYPNATVITLEKNYRSTKTILAAANEIIKKNSKRKEKNLYTENPDGEKITLTATSNEEGEANFVANTCSQIIGNGLAPDKIAVLYRANFQSRAIEEALLKIGIPYQVLGTRFFDRKEVKDILSYIKFALNQSDFESLKRIVTAPPRGIGKVALAKIAGGQTGDLSGKARSSYQELMVVINEIKERLTKDKIEDVLKFTLTASGLEKSLRDGTEEGTERLENIKELVSLSAKYQNMTGEEAALELITEAALISDQDTLQEKKDGVRLMTIHASKGLEFNTVFVTGLEQGLFPHEGFAGDESRDDEEERRLFYVAITRAGRKLYLSYAQTRMIFGSRQVNIPSEFILDLPEDLIESEMVEEEYEMTHYLD